MDGIHTILTHYKALGIIVILVIVAFPIITTSMMWAERVGYFTNVYQAEHAILRHLAIEQGEISRNTLHKHDELLEELITNRVLIHNGNYFQQRTCVNTAGTADEKEKCLVKPWGRKME